MAASARTARSRACSTGLRSPTPIPACAPRRWRWTRLAAKAIFAAAGLPVARGRVVPIDELEAADPMPRPYVVKPMNEGSSVGVHIVRQGDNRRAADRPRAGASGRCRAGRGIHPRARADRRRAGRPGADRDRHPRRRTASTTTSRNTPPGGSLHVIPAAMHASAYAQALDVAARGAPRAGLPRRRAGRFPLRRHRRRAWPPGAAGDEHPAGPDAHLPAARAGGASSAWTSRRCAPGWWSRPHAEREARRPRNSVNDRPSRIKLLLRRQKRRLRPAGWIAFGFAVLLVGYGAVHSGAPGGLLAQARAHLSRVAAVAGLRVTDIVIEGRANTPEPLLRAALGVSRGDPILGFSLDRRPGAHRDAELGRARHRGAPPAQHHRGEAGRTPAVRGVAEPGEIRADRPAGPAGDRSGRFRSSATCRSWSAPAPPSRPQRCWMR